MRQEFDKLPPVKEKIGSVEDGRWKQRNVARLNRV